MRDIIQRMSNTTPSATQGLDNTVIYDHGLGSSAGIPFLRKKFPKTLLRTTTVAQIQVLMRSRVASVVMGAGQSPELTGTAAALAALLSATNFLRLVRKAMYRSEERRVGKEGRSRWS